MPRKNYERLGVRWGIVGVIRRLVSERRILRTIINEVKRLYATATNSEIIKSTLKERQSQSLLRKLGSRSINSTDRVAKVLGCRKNQHVQVKVVMMLWNKEEARWKNFDRFVSIPADSSIKEFHEDVIMATVKGAQEVAEGKYRVPRLGQILKTFSKRVSYHSIHCI